MRPFLVESPPRTYRPWVPTLESEFEAQVLRVSKELMPGFAMANWKPLIKDWHGHGARPDLAMLSHDLESWYVVEVELASHSISTHIAPQLETLRHGVYDSSIVRSLQEAFPSEGAEALTRMVRREPGLLCIVDQYTDRIWRACRDAGFELAVFEPYLGVQGGWAVLVERLPGELGNTSVPSAYYLRRGSRLGGINIVMLLPRNFPASFQKVRVPVAPGSSDYQSVQVQRFDDGPGMILPIALVSEQKTARVEVVDPSRNIIQLVIEET